MTMRKNIIITLFAAAMLLMFPACKKYTQGHQTIELENKAYLKVIHAAPGFTQVFNAPDNFNVLVGGTASSQRIVASFTYNSAFPANTLNTNTYAAVPAGAQDIRLVTRGTVNIDSTPIAVFPKNLTAGSYYTLIITDSITTPPAASKIFTQDAVFRPTDGNYTVRFIHAVMNDTAGRTVDIYSARQAGNLYTNVAPGTVRDFLVLPRTSNLSDTLIVRRSGTMQELARLNGVSFSNRRVYTIIYRGNTTITASTNVRARGIIVHNNL
jgi:hypothetical protein